MPVSAFESRRLALQRKMAGHKLDALLVSHAANVRYLTGFTGSNGLALMRAVGIQVSDEEGEA